MCIRDRSLESRVVWWPATVLSIQPYSTRQRTCAGELLYHKFERYEAVQTSVVFTASSTYRNVSSDRDSLYETECEQSSWLFSNENQSDGAGNESPSPPAKNVHNPRSYRKGNGRTVNAPRQSVNRGSIASSKARSNASPSLGWEGRGITRARTRAFTPKSTKLEAAALETKITKKGAKKVEEPMEEDQKNNSKTAPYPTVKFMPSKISTDKELSSSEDIIRATNPDTRQNVHSNDDGSVQKGSLEDYNISIRLRLLEKQVQNNFHLCHQSLSSSSMSVVVS